MAERLFPSTGAAFSPQGALDTARLRQAIEAAEEGLAAAGRVMPPDRKADLVLAIYDLLDDKTITRDRVLKLIKFAA